MTHQTAEVQLVSRKEMRKQQTKPKRVRRSRNVRTPVTMIAAIGLLATFALPSYGFDPETTAMSGLTRDNRLVQFSAPSQGLSVATVRAVEFSRGDYEPAEASEFQVTTTRSRSYTGPLAEDYWVKPRYTNLTSALIMRSSAEQVGVPYVSGGETPAGFDCSGYVMFIYSQFGIPLPHSVYQQSKLGVKIDIEDAVPGDIVVFNDFSHNGIYAGNGNFYHAPQRGDRVKLAPIFTPRYHIIRLVDING